jgi:hypothetical protein
MLYAVPNHRINRAGGVAGPHRMVAFGVGISERVLPPTRERPLRAGGDRSTIASDAADNARAVASDRRGVVAGAQHPLAVVRAASRSLTMTARMWRRLSKRRSRRVETRRCTACRV